MRHKWIIKMLKITEITKNLNLLEEGIWISKNTSKISYPKEDNINCFKIEEQSFWFKHRNNCLIEILKRFPPQGILFDVGGGNGYVSLGIKNSGFDTILVEPGIEGARNAKLRGLSPIICSTLEDAGFKENTIPAIGFFDVIEHIEDDTGYLKKVKSFLVENGRLYLTAPAHNILWSIEDDYGGHYRRYTLKELTKKLKSVGYEIDYATYFFSFLPLPIFLFRTIPSRIGLRQKNQFKQIQKEHKPKQGILSCVLNWCCKKELSKIKRTKISFGASCLIVARSKN